MASCRGVGQRKWCSKDNLFLGVLVIVSVQCVVVQSQNSEFCKHNEFRCADGSGCLPTEKLCNGEEDCANGEDEKGNSQWDCNKETLQTQCNPDELKCRFGGCFHKDKKCDGVPDCWGGNDESVDLCTPRSPVRRPNLPPEFNPAVRKPGSFEPILIKVQTITLPPTTTPQPATTQRLKPGGTSRVRGCPPLEPEDGVTISCYSERFAKVFDCTDRMIRSPMGTEATHECSEYYSSPKTAGKLTTRFCNADGTWSPKNPNWRCDLKCGIAGHDFRPFIVGGEESVPNRWPWHVALYHEDPPGSGKLKYVCGGTLISTRAVLTAAHCVTHRRSREIVEPIRVIVGKHHSGYYVNETDDKHSREFEVVDVDVHESYEPTSFNADIAIIWLSHAVTIGTGARPSCLPSRKDNVSPGDDPEYTGTLAGWGRTKNSTVADILQEINLPVIEIDKCKKSHPTLRLLVRESTFCAGFRSQAQSACDGDSGGGLVFKSPEQEKYIVKGVVSAGVGRRGGGCDYNHYTIFTKVSTYREWIDHHLSLKGP